MQTRPRWRSDRGIALIIVLWVVMLLAIMVQSFTAEIRADTQLTRNLIDNGAARAMANGGVHTAIARLLRERTNYSAVFDGEPVTLALEGGSITLATQDEGGKINLNAAPDPLIEALLKSAGLDSDAASDLVDRIADWRDRDNLRRLNGAEDGDYRSANLPYGAKDQAFAAVEELRLVLGVTPSLYTRVAPALTVYDNKRGVDLRAAPESVLRALMTNDDGAIDDFLSARREHDKQAINRAQESFGISRRFVSSSSRSVFTIRATARTTAGGAFTREAVVRLGRNRAQPFSILAWRRGAEPEYGGRSDRVERSVEHETAQ